MATKSKTQTKTARKKKSASKEKAPKKPSRPKRSSRPSTPGRLADWTQAADRLIADAMKASTAETSEVERIFGRAPTIAVAGPTGSGKSALINAVIGVSLLPEGTNHTTPVPTVVQRGSDNTWRLRAIGVDGRTLTQVPTLELSTDAFTGQTTRPDGAQGILDRLDRQDDHRAGQQERMARNGTGARGLHRCAGNQAKVSWCHDCTARTSNSRSF